MYLILYKQGRCELRRAYSQLLYIKPTEEPEFVLGRLAEFDSKANHKFGCFNSLDQTTEELRNTIIDWIERRIGLK